MLPILLLRQLLNSMVTVDMATSLINPAMVVIVTPTSLAQADVAAEAATLILTNSPLATATPINRSKPLR